MEFANIKNIIFDLGGVILNIDYNLTVKAFEALGIKNAEIIYSKKRQTEIFDLLETGKLTEEEFCESIRKISGITATNEEIIKAWNAMLLDFPEDITDVLKKAKNKYRTFLLSNTNAIHYKAYSKILKEQLGKESLAELFEKQYLSHEIGLRKPGVEVFRLILDENGLKAEETLFIDDSYQHIEGAAKAGLKTHWLQDNNLKKFLTENNII